MDNAGAAAHVQGVWATYVPKRKEYAEVVKELNALTMVGGGSVFTRGPHVQATHLAYLKPPMDAVLTSLKSKDRRSAKEWEYINADGVWADMTITAFTIAKTTKETDEELGARLELTDKSLADVREMLTMREKYFRDLTEHGI